MRMFRCCWWLNCPDARRGFLNFPTSDFSLLPDLPNCQGWTSWLLWITQRYATAIPYLCSVAACKTLSCALRPQRSDGSSKSDSTDDAQATLRLVDFAAKHFHGANSPKLVTACEFLTVASGVLFSDNATCWWDHMQASSRAWCSLHHYWQSQARMQSPNFLLAQSPSTVYSTARTQWLFCKCFTSTSYIDCNTC